MEPETVPQDVRVIYPSVTVHARDCPQCGADCPRRHEQVGCEYLDLMAGCEYLGGMVGCEYLDGADGTCVSSATGEMVGPRAMHHSISCIAVHQTANHLRSLLYLD